MSSSNNSIKPTITTIKKKQYTTPSMKVMNVTTETGINIVEADAKGFSVGVVV